jgi:hypothetical protein
MIQDRRHQLYNRLKSFRSVQAVYMPQAVLLLQDKAENDAPDTVENAILFLLNEIASRQRNFDLVHNLSSTEGHLRFGQATDSLCELRRSLCVKAHLVKYKRDEVRGQRPNTRACALLDRAQAQIDAVVEGYNAARKAYFQLVGPGIWEDTLKVLHPQDVRTMSDAEDASGQDRQLGEGYRTTSWIWMTSGVRSVDGDVESPEMHDGICSFTFICLYCYLLSSPASTALRVEWAKCRARRNRWIEEVLLIQEEMRRTIAFCEYKAEQWTEHVTARPGLQLDILDGVRAYAHYQAAIQRNRAASFHILFSSALGSAESTSGNNEHQGQDTSTPPEHTVDDGLDDNSDEDFDEYEFNDCEL